MLDFHNTWPPEAGKVSFTESSVERLQYPRTDCEYDVVYFLGKSAASLLATPIGANNAASIITPLIQEFDNGLATSSVFMQGFEDELQKNFQEAIV